jgi:hypothetical protein
MVETKGHDKSCKEASHYTNDYHDLQQWILNIKCKFRIEPTFPDVVDPKEAEIEALIELFKTTDCTISRHHNSNQNDP